MACTGSGNITFGTIDHSDGVFFLTSSIRFADLVDGSSHTAAFSERMLGNGLTATTQQVPDAQLYILELGNGLDVNLSTCATLGSGDWYAQRSAKWILGNMATRFITTSMRQIRSSGIA